MTPPITVLVSGPFIELLAITVLATASTRPSAVSEGTGIIQRMTCALWTLIVIHLLLLDGFKTLASPEEDGDPVFHQSVAISLPLVLLRLPGKGIDVNCENAASMKAFVPALRL